MASKRIAPTESPLRDPRELLARYSMLFPSCRTDNCDGIADLGDRFCDRCASDREHEQRMAAKAAARRG
jgi:hypothetical protein